uniref:Chalcone/stilbene synthase C-terminal domain-containing protein n=1 Tax=Oryza barthii TaxID=65489 RepID=A0A0D3EQY3_9ORYZ
MATGERTMIEKRHLYTSDDLLRSTPSITAYNSTSLTLRQELANHGVPRLGAEAARAAIADWGGRASDITHLVFVTSTSGCLPGADFELLGLLGLPPSTKRAMVEILDRMESKLGLGKEKLEASRAVMAQYGNTRSSCVVLVMEEMRRWSEERGLRTAGEGLDMGMLVGFGPGLTVETIVLRALPIN